MKVIQLVGTRESGKTTTAEILIKQLKESGYSVGTIKMIGCPAFSLDKSENSNTRRHRQAGADIVIAAGKKETDIMYDRPLTMDEMLEKLNAQPVDFCIVEGGYEADLTRIVCVKDAGDATDKITSNTICISGPAADHICEYKDLPAISALKDPEGLVSFVIDNAKELSLPVNVLGRPQSVTGYCNGCSHGL